jgi:hypothetical protein
VEIGRMKLTSCDLAIKIRVALGLMVHFRAQTADRERGLADDDRPKIKISGKFRR